MGERTGTKGLQLWCRLMTDGYPGVSVNNMTTSWRDGLALCAIIHRFRPDLIDFSKLKKDDIYYNNDLAFRIAERHFGIAPLLEPEDMVECPVPDRLSILTYLSGFYHTFRGSQASPTRIVPKRPATASDRGVVSPTSTSPTSKMPRPSGGRSSGEPCTKCGLPVFIAERLSVKKQLYHRTCFRCARCNSQLSLANYYETETEKQFCCETCPDEEQLEQNEKDLIEKSVLTRSLSDEEKSAGIQKFDEQDDYSCLFETALEDPNDTKLTKNYTLSSEQSAEFIKARSRFMTSQLVSDYDDDSSENEVPDLPNSEPPSLPQSEPPDLPKTQPPDFDEFVAKSELIIVDDQVEKTIENSENTEVENFKDLSENISSIVSSDSGFPSHTQSLDSLVHSSVKVSEISDRSQPETANKQLDINKFVTKENKFPRSDGKAPTSLVKSRMRLFENKFAGDQSTEIDNSSVEDVNKSVVEKFIQKVPSEEEEKQSSTGLENKKHDVEEIETDNTINSVDIEDNKSHTEQKIEEQTSVEDHEKNILISNDLPELQIENTSDINEIILISDDEEKSSEISSNDVKELKIDKVDNSSSIIIIDDEEKSSEISSNNLKELKINNVDTSSSIIIIDDSKEETNEKYPEDLNPFGDEEEEPTTKPNTSLNPFGDDEDEIEEKKPSPKPAVRRKIKPSSREVLVSGQSDGTPE